MTALGYKSPRSAALIIDELVQKKILAKRSDGTLQLIVKQFENNRTHARTVNIPLVGTVACGAPILANENIEGLISVSIDLARPSFRYFLLRAQGDSMNNAGINDGDILLVRQQNYAENGDRVVALIDDEATVKIFEKTDSAIILRPKSTNTKHKPIILTRDFRVQGIVKAVLPSDI